jgi:hypothetical protein
VATSVCPAGFLSRCRGLIAADHRLVHSLRFPCDCRASNTTQRDVCRQLGRSGPLRLAERRDLQAVDVKQWPFVLDVVVG